MLDFLNNLFADGTTTVRNGVSFVVLVLVIVTLAKAKLAVATSVIIIVVAGFVIYCASFGGLEQIAQLFQTEVSAQI